MFFLRQEWSMSELLREYRHFLFKVI
jgi:hypothetical protein